MCHKLSLLLCVCQQPRSSLSLCLNQITGNLFHRRHWHHPDTAIVDQMPHGIALSLWQQNEINTSKYLLLLLCAYIFMLYLRRLRYTSLCALPSVHTGQPAQKPSSVILPFRFVLRINDRIDSPYVKSWLNSSLAQWFWKKKYIEKIVLFCPVRFWRCFRFR